MGGLLSLRVWWFDDEGKTGGSTGGGFQTEGTKNEFVGEVNKPVVVGIKVA